MDGLFGAYPTISPRPRTLQLAKRGLCSAQAFALSLKPQSVTCLIGSSLECGNP